jgi:hypothetical protein
VVVKVLPYEDFMVAAKYFLNVVIPGRRVSGEPGIHNHHREYGFRARDFVAPRNDGWG